MKIKLDKKDKTWEAISVSLLLINALLIALTLPSLPDRVPIHFNSAGQPNGWGHKYTLWLIFALAVLMYGLMTFISNRPGLYQFRMTKNNVEAQYRLTAKMARTLKAFILLAFVCLTTFMLMNARGNWTELNPACLFLVFFGLIIPPCLYYALKISKIR